VTALALLATSQATAEPVGSYFSVAPFVGYTIFDGSLRFPGYPLRDRFNLGARLGYRYNAWLGAEAAAGYTPTSEDSVNGRDVKFMHGSLDVVFTPYSGRYGEPFILIGGGGGRPSCSAIRRPAQHLKEEEK